MEKHYASTYAETSRSYSRSVTVDSPGRIVYFAGIVNLDPERVPVLGSFEESTRAMFARLGDALEGAGGTLEDIVTMTVYITDSRWGDEFVRIRSDYFRDESYPASALITVAGLGRPEFVVEAQVVAAMG